MKGQGNFVIPFIFVQILRWDIFISNGESSSSLWYDFFLLLSKLLDIDAELLNVSIRRIRLFTL